MEAWLIVLLGFCVIYVVGIVLVLIFGEKNKRDLVEVFFWPFMLLEVFIN